MGNYIGSVTLPIQNTDNYLVHFGYIRDPLLNNFSHN